MTAAALFVLFASAFLLLLYYFLSEWTIWILVVIFCVAGIEVNLLCLFHSYVLIKEENREESR
jgi:heme/copper-type cytochrome/quinol oxidase subunit 4